ncbi:cytochrome P450 [Pluteus cervinus]|uniref:Cytochrome P450 n=1 Tax=Pluteus cervinus TaxID=181527 RepID=A0ACD3B6F1_9AGAR|nr:cytochrome P450 [Pluteus cervinus]
MPYTVGLQTAAAAFLSAGLPIQFTFAIVSFLLIVFLLDAFQHDVPDTPKSLPRCSLLAIHPFFRKRFEFLNWGIYATGSTVFKFKLLRNTVVVVSGESARQAFFAAKELDLTEGFKILSGAIPMVKGVTSDLQSKRIALIHKRLAAVQREASLSQLIPVILEDIRKQMDSWDGAGTFDPFDKIYELLFQVTIRSLSCSEIADDPVLVSRLKVLYDKLETGTTPATVLLPWLPTPSMIKKLWATKEIYDIVVRAIDARQKSGVYKRDTLQMLLETGDDRLVVVGFIMGLIIAGARATGTTACWLSTYLGGHPEWRAKAAQEVSSLLAAHWSASSERESLSKRLAAIPLKAWETEAPVLDSLIRETTRVAQPHVAMRRNIGRDIYIDGKIIPTGSYVVYPFSDVHLDPELYSDPWKFDPGRQEPKEVPLSYIGWGAGKTTCLGTRLAKVELKLVTAMLVLGFRHSVVDADDQLRSLPTPNWNDTLLCRPNERFYLKYEKTDQYL